MFSSHGPLWSRPDPPWPIELRFCRRDPWDAAARLVREPALDVFTFLLKLVSNQRHAGTFPSWHFNLCNEIHQWNTHAVYIIFPFLVISSQKKFVLRNSLPPGPFQVPCVQWEKRGGLSLGPEVGLAGEVGVCGHVASLPWTHDPSSTDLA